jgi:hypothetical protein
VALTLPDAVPEPLALGVAEDDALREADTLLDGVTEGLAEGDAVAVADGDVEALCEALAVGVTLIEADVLTVSVAEMLRLRVGVADTEAVAARVFDGEEEGEMLAEALIEALTEAEIEGSGAQSPAPSTAASCAPSSALPHSRTSVKAPGQAICPVKDWPPRKGALPHMAPAEDWLCGGAQAAVELATHCAAAALSKYRLSVNRLLPPGSGASVSATVCQRPSERPPAAVAQSAVPP